MNSALGEGSRIIIVSVTMTATSLSIYSMPGTVLRILQSKSDLFLLHAHEAGLTFHDLLSETLHIIVCYLTCPKGLGQHPMIRQVHISIAKIHSLK